MPDDGYRGWMKLNCSHASFGGADLGERHLEPRHNVDKCKSEPRRARTSVTFSSPSSVPTRQQPSRYASHALATAAEVVLDEVLEGRRRRAQHGLKAEQVGVLTVGKLVAVARRRANLRRIAGFIVARLGGEHEALNGNKDLECSR
jgi:hypothetical protein